MNVALKHISALLSDEQLVEKLPGSFKKVIAIELEENSNEIGYRFKQVSLENFDVEGDSKYLYRGGGTSGTGVTLTCKLGKPNKKDKKQKTAKEFAATSLNKKVIGYLHEMAAKAATEEGRQFGRLAASALEKNQEDVLEHLTKFAEQIAFARDENAIVTLVISGEDREYPQNIKPLRDYFAQRVNPETKEMKGTASVGENAICSCCGRLSKRVFCQPQTLPYFTLDKPGFIAGGFFKEEDWQTKAWRNFPLCSDCLLAIRRGFKAVEEKLRFSLCGITYFLIPNFADWQSHNAYTVTQTIAQLGKVTDVSLQRDQEILFAHRLSGEENAASFTFLFYRKKQSRLEILCTLENVMPSRLSEIAAAVDGCERHDLLARFGEWTKATNVGAIPVNFGLLKDLYQPSLNTKGSQPVVLFLKAVQRVVYGQPFDASEFFDASTRYIRAELREQQAAGREPWLTLATHRCLGAAFWLLHLGLLNFDQPQNGT
jgi:CRISPR-associated protein Csh1